MFVHLPRRIISGKSKNTCILPDVSSRNMNSVAEHCCVQTFDHFPRYKERQTQSENIRDCIFSRRSYSDIFFHSVKLYTVSYLFFFYSFLSLPHRLFVMFQFQATLKNEENKKHKRHVTPLHVSGPLSILEIGRSKCS